MEHNKKINCGKQYSSKLKSPRILMTSLLPWEELVIAKMRRIKRPKPDMLEISLQQAHPDSNKVDQLHYSSTYQNDFAKSNPGQRMTKFPLPKEMEVLDYKVSSSHQEYQYSEALNCCNTRYGKTQYNHSEPIIGIPFKGKCSDYTTTYSSHFGCKD